MLSILQREESSNLEVFLTDDTPEIHEIGLNEEKDEDNCIADNLVKKLK